jgi:acetyl-CoA/propionyl-CoA carboxylase biotin carboxyl carrier protein
MPAGPGIRVDTAVEEGDRIPAEYDPLIAKLVAHAESREAAIARLRRALAETEIGGLQTTLPFHRAILDEPVFVDARELATDWVDRHWDGPRARARAVRAAAVAAALAALAGDRPGPAGVSSPPSPAAGQADGDGGAAAWRTGGRSLTADRWPR